MKKLLVILIPFLLASCTSDFLLRMKKISGMHDENLSGEYLYHGKGVAVIEQHGDQIQILLSWTPRGKGPDYEVLGTVDGNTITGKWYYHYANIGWFDFHGEISPSGDKIDFAKSEDPLRSDLNKIVLESPKAIQKKEEETGFIFEEHFEEDEF